MRNHVSQNTFTANNSLYRSNFEKISNPQIYQKLKTHLPPMTMRDFKNKIFWKPVDFSVTASILQEKAENTVLGKLLGASCASHHKIEFFEASLDICKTQTISKEEKVEKEQIEAHWKVRYEQKHVRTDVHITPWKCKHVCVCAYVSLHVCVQVLPVLRVLKLLKGLKVHIFVHVHVHVCCVCLRHRHRRNVTSHHSSSLL